jgi:hypothetical protein
VHHHGDAGRLAGFIIRVHGAVAGGEPGVDQVDLQRHRAEVKLAADLLVNRIV